MVQGDAAEERDASDQTVGGEATHPGSGPGPLRRWRWDGESALTPRSSSKQSVWSPGLSRCCKHPEHSTQVRPVVEYRVTIHPTNDAQTCKRYGSRGHHAGPGFHLQHPRVR